MNARTTFEYDGRTFRVEEINGEHFVKIGDTLRKVKLQADGTFKKGWSGRNPGTSNSTTSNAEGLKETRKGQAATSGLWAKLAAAAVRQFGVTPDTVTVYVSKRTVTLNVSAKISVNSGIFTHEYNAPICTWSANLTEWLEGNPGVMSPATSVQSVDGLAAIAGFATTLNEWHK